MDHRDCRCNANLDRTTHALIPRRTMVGSSSLAALLLLSRSVAGQTNRKEANAEKARPTPPKEFQEGVDRSRAFSERMRSAGSMEERQQIMNERMAWQRQQASEDLKEQLRISDKEWPVVKPRLQAVYDLVHPARPMTGRNEQPKSEIEQRSRELRDAVQAENPVPDQIKAKLSALRAAKERANQKLAQARQDLRQIMNLHQEAVLVLNGLLD